MIRRKLLGFVLSLLVLASVPVSQVEAQKPSPEPAAVKAGTPDAKAAAPAAPDGGEPRYIRPETPEQRKERLGTVEDPGPNPDEEKIWWRFGKQYKIGKFDKEWVTYTDRPGWVKAMAFVNFADELYQENDKYVWVWLEQMEKVKTPTEEEVRKSRYQPLDEKQIAFLEGILDEYTPVEVPKASVKVRFEKASDGLPSDGSWRNSLTVADMNGDGRQDVVLPSQRGASSGTPSIYLGDGKGTWTYWKEVEFPDRIDYGSVVAADFDKDGKMDLGFGVHLSGIGILYGDGKGRFRQILRTTDFPTRRIIARDVDADGWMDIVAISEGPVLRGKNLNGAGFTNLRAYMNRKKGREWEGTNIAAPKQRVSGDWLAAGNFNGDKYPDFIGSSLYYGAIETLYLSKNRPGEYELFLDEGKLVPFFSYYTATTAGRFSSRDRDDAIVTFTRNWAPRIDPDLVPPPPYEKVMGIDRISFAGGTPTRTPIARWGTPEAIMVTGINNGDFDGDGKLDLIVARPDLRRFVLMLGDGRGGFREAAIEGTELGTQPHYDLAVADVNGDKRPDLLIMYESEEGTSFARKNGKVDVFLNRGVVKQ